MIKISIVFKKYLTFSQIFLAFCLDRAYIVTMNNIFGILPGKKIHFVGVLGVSMSALAKLVSISGYDVTGSDIRLTEEAAELNRFGISVSRHSAENVAGSALVVYTDAVTVDNAELAEARRLGIVTVKRAELLGEISRQFEDVIAVSGTHGKSTTTAMLAKIFTDAGRNPTVHIGVNPNLIVGGDKLFITEACEYKRNLLLVKRNCAVILNVDLDHTDYFRDVEDIKACFTEFAAGANSVVVAGDDENARGISGMRFGFSPSCDVSAQCLKCDSRGRFSFDLFYQGEKVGRICLAVIGRHNVMNALAAIAVALSRDVAFETIKRAIEDFKGIKRRQEYVGECNGASVLSDYAHHPKEIAEVVAAVRNIKYNRLFIAYEPHTFSRLKSFMTEFSDVFSGAHEVFVLKVYAAREKQPFGVTSKKLVRQLNRKNISSKYCKNYEAANVRIRKTVKSGDLLLILGAGDIYKLCPLVVN